MGMHACLPSKEEEGSQDPLGWNERGLCPPIHWTRKGPLLPKPDLSLLWSLCKETGGGQVGTPFLSWHMYLYNGCQEVQKSPPTALISASCCCTVVAFCVIDHPTQ